jgi:phage tail sheath gpL-like
MDFDTIPSTVRVPLAYVEFNSTRAVVGSPAVPSRILVLGQTLAAGSAAPLVPVQVTSADQAEALFGRGSMLAAMVKALKANNRYTESWALPLSDDVAAVAAAGSILLGGLPTVAGTLNLYIGGTRVRIAVAVGATPGSLATALAAAINADTSLPVTAAVNGVTPEQVDLTARNKGEAGNGIDVRVNYYQGETLPAGLTAAVVALAGGTANPDLTDAIAALGDDWYQTIVMPYTDAANLTLLEAELADRFGGVRQIDGIAYAAFRGTHGATSTFGGTRNSPHVSHLGTGIAPTPPYLLAAIYAGQAAAALAIDPARPLQTLPLIGALPPAVDARWTQEERNLLLYDGVATYSVDNGGVMRIERAITSYQTNAFGVADTAYLDVTTPATLSYLRYSLRARITTKFPRHKLADDGTSYGPGQAIVTPKTLRAELVALAKEWAQAGLVENLDQYKAELTVERDAVDRNRVNILVPPDLVNQLRIFAAQVQFIL